MTYARLWDTFSRSKRAQEQVCRPPGSDVASIPARLFAYVKFLPVSLQGPLELYRALTLDPEYKANFDLLGIDQKSIDFHHFFKHIVMS